MIPARLSFGLLLLLLCRIGGSSVAAESKSNAWVEDLPEDEVFWGIRGLMKDESMSFSSKDCDQVDVSFLLYECMVYLHHSWFQAEISHLTIVSQVSVACLANVSGEGDEGSDCNSFVASDDTCKRFPYYIHAIENTGPDDVEIKSLTVERDGSAPKIINTSPTLPGHSIRLVQERIGGVDFCEKEHVVTKATIEAKEPESCEEDANAYKSGALPTPPSPTLPPTRFSYELAVPDRETVEHDRMANITDCNDLDYTCDVDSLCGFSGDASGAEFGAEDWIKVTKGLKADCNIPGFEFYAVEGPYCSPPRGCSVICRMELVCEFEE